MSLVCVCWLADVLMMFFGVEICLGLYSICIADVHEMLYQAGGMPMLRVAHKLCAGGAYESPMELH
jgi:hypothetical protein